MFHNTFKVKCPVGSNNNKKRLVLSETDECESGNIYKMLVQNHGIVGIAAIS